MNLTNGRIRVTIDPESACIRRLQDVQSGIVHLDSDRPVGLFRILTPSDRWWSRYADADQQPPPDVTQRGKSGTLRYGDLIAADNTSIGVSAEVTVEASERPDEVVVRLSLTNTGSSVINEVRCPWFSGWTGIGGPGRDSLVLGARNVIDPHAFPRPAGNTYARNHQRRFAEYPVNLFAPWADISGPGGGMALLHYMRQPENGGVSLENMAGYGPGLDLAVGWAHLVQIEPGQSWQSPPLGIAVHGGDWHETADRYREWFDSHHPPGRGRSGIRQMIGFQNVFFRGFDGTPIRPLEQLPAVAATGRRRGVNHLCVWDTLTLGNYAKHSDRDLTDYPPDERALLKKVLGQARREGTHTGALINFRHPVASEALEDPAISQQVQRRFDGTFRTENWSGSHHHCDLFVKHLGPESWIYSPFSPQHRDRVMRITEEYLDLGYSFMFYDQPFEIHPDYGFAGTGHRPQDTHAAALDLVRAVRRRILADNPDAIIVGEECDAFAADAVDMWMSWRISQRSVAPEVAMTRYAMPHAMLSWVIDHEPERAALAFAMGMYMCLMVHGGEGTLDDEPKLARLVSRLAQLRTRTADRTVLGRFVHTRGLSVDADDELVAFSYESEQGPAVIIAAPGASARGRIRVERDAFAIPASSAEGALFHLDGSEEMRMGNELELSLEANEAAVWTL